MKGVVVLIASAIPLLSMANDAFCQDQALEDRIRAAAKDMQELQILQDLIVSRGSGCLIELQVYNTDGLDKSDCKQFSAIMNDYTPKYKHFFESYRDVLDAMPNKIKEFQEKGITKVYQLSEPYKSFFTAFDTDKAKEASNTIEKVTAAIKYLR